MHSIAKAEAMLEVRDPADTRSEVAEVPAMAEGAAVRFAW